MLTYDQFASRSRSQYLPYVMGFNAADYRSEAINTDRLGFRLAYDAQGRPVSVGTLEASTLAEVNLLVGASSALGYGASSDAASVASRLSTHDPDATPWLNFAGIPLMRPRIDAVRAACSSTAQSATHRDHGRLQYFGHGASS